MGYDFHRLKPIDNYILDFSCKELLLAVELDGYSHQIDEVYFDFENVLKSIENYIRDFDKTHPQEVV